MTDLTWTQKWIGAPFADKGRGPAYDCWGLLWAVLRVQFGVEVPSYPGVSGEMDNRDQVKELFEAPAELERWEEVPAGQERPGDGVLIRMRGQPWHVGVVAGDGMMLHIRDIRDAAGNLLPGSDACLEDYRSSKWRRRILGFYRWRGGRV
jgi:cell wall-associated NlpC family hydrolase